MICFLDCKRYFKFVEDVIREKFILALTGCSPASDHDVESSPGYSSLPLLILLYTLSDLSYQASRKLAKPLIEAIAMHPDCY